MDHVHQRADRHRRPAPGGGAVYRGRAGTVSRGRHQGDPARRRRLRGEEGRHELLHDSRDVRVHRRLRRARRIAEAWRSSSKFTATIRIRSTWRASRLGLRLRAPPLVLHALYARDLTPLKRWLGIRPRNAVTVLDTHDGIGVQDVDAAARRPGPGASAAGHSTRSSEPFTSAAGGESRHASGTSAGNVDVHQINCTFYDALGGATTNISSRARFSASCQASRRSTTWGCSPAATTWNCCGAPVSAATSTVTTTRTTKWRAHGSGPSSRSLCDFCDFGTAIPLSAAVTPSADRSLVLEWRNGADGPGWTLTWAGCAQSIVATGRGRTAVGYCSGDGQRGTPQLALVKALTYLMFAMFAMTTDSVGIIIPEVIRTFGLADRSRRVSIRDDGRDRGGRRCFLGSWPTGSAGGRFVAGLTLFAAACFLSRR